MIVFVDMDGVLADFNGRIASLAGSTVEEMVIPGNYSSVAGIGMSGNDMWKLVDNDKDNFFAALQPYPWTDLFMRTLEDRVGEENVAILSSPAQGAAQAANCVAGKVYWIYKYLPRYSKRYFLGSAKEMLAHPGAVLIDDADKKIRRFIQGGGHGILFPQRWNSHHMLAAEDKRLGYVNSKLDTILREAT